MRTSIPRWSKALAAATPPIPPPTIATRSGLVLMASRIVPRERKGLQDASARKSGSYRRGKVLILATDEATCACPAKQPRAELVEARWGPRPPFDKLRARSLLRWASMVITSEGFGSPVMLTDDVPRGFGRYRKRTKPPCAECWIGLVSL